MITPATPTTTLSTGQAADRLGEFTVVDVRSPGEYAGGHLPGAHNVPLERLDEGRGRPGGGRRARAAAARVRLRARSAKGCARLAARGVEAATLQGGTGARGRRPATRSSVRPGPARRGPWTRQVRLAAGSLVAAGFLAGRVWRPGHWLSGAIGAGLVFSG